MRFCSINIYSGENKNGNKKKELTKKLRNDSNLVVDAYLKSLKYYTNENCISLNISCDEDTEKYFLEEIAKGYPVLHIPFDLERYLQIPESSKDEYWLTVIRNAIEYVCNIWNWEHVFSIMFISGASIFLKKNKGVDHVSNQEKENCTLPRQHFC